VTTPTHPEADRPTSPPAAAGSGGQDRAGAPAARRRLLEELRARIATLSDAAYHLEASSVRGEFDFVAQSAYSVYDLARNLAGPVDVTGCLVHPTGAVDPMPPPGWGRCLLCNDLRRRGSPHAHATLEGVCPGCERPYPADARIPAGTVCADCTTPT